MTTMPSQNQTGSLAIPDEWVPAGTYIGGFVIHDHAHSRWEAILPGFSIVGMGDTAEDAADQAMSLLREYFALCAADGLTFEESHRRLGRRWVWAAVAAVTRAYVHERRRKLAVRRLHRSVLPAH